MLVLSLLMKFQTFEQIQSRFTFIKLMHKHKTELNSSHLEINAEGFFAELLELLKCGYAMLTSLT